MNKIISKLSLCRLSLVSFIFLCGVFSCVNAFSRQHWSKENTVVTYDERDRTININLLVYDYKFVKSVGHGFLYWCDLLYSEDNKSIKHLMRIEIKQQEGKELTWLQVRRKKQFEKIQFIDCVKPENNLFWPNDVTDLKIAVDITKKPYYDEDTPKESKHSFLNLKWFLPLSCIQVKTIKMMGYWWVDDAIGYDKIECFYNPEVVKSKSKTIKTAPSALMSGLCDEVKVTGYTEGIVVTGAEAGENIKVYAVSGAEVKSVVAKDDVKILLAKNQIYLVKAGHNHFKVAL